MNRILGTRACFAAALMLFLAGTAQAQVTIHVKNPWPTMPIWEGMKVVGGVIAGPPGAPMQDDGDGWYSYVLPATVPANGAFHFVLYSPAAWDTTKKSADYASARSIYYNAAVTGSGPGTEFTAEQIRDLVEDVWIIPNTTGAPTVTITPQGKKVVMFFNPWPSGGAMGKIGNAASHVRLLQSLDPARCGWYGVYMNAAPWTVAFKSLFGNDTYGMNGPGDAKAVDLTSAFATSDTVFVYPANPGAPLTIAKTIPAGLKGVCNFKLAVTVYDFSKEHPDFDDPALDKQDNAHLGMVGHTLDADRKPVLGSKPFVQSDFRNWFRSNPTGVKATGNVASCYDLPMKKGTNALWGYDSFKDSPSYSFFPVDDKNTWGEWGKSQYYNPKTNKSLTDPTKADHNFNFCMEMHATFKYEKGQVFSFVGDDDTWAFIDGKLALDIGGTHPALDGKIELDKLGLTPGKEYPFDFFFCERQPTGSDLAIETSIFFEQQQRTFSKKIDLGGGNYRYEIWEITSGDMNCGATKGGDTLLTQAEFRLTGPSVPTPEVLAVGTKYGGVTVLPTMDQVTVDTTKITGLRPGLYTITFTTKSGFGTLQFQVPGTYGIEFTGKTAVNEILNVLVPVNIQSTWSGSPDKRAEQFKLKAQAGLTVYSDSTLTKPIADGTVLTTDAATGTFKVWVSSATPGTYKLDLWSGPGQLTLFDTYNNLTFFQQPKVATPTANPPAMTFILPINVALASSTTGAEIWYTIDNSDPKPGTGTAVKYSAGIPVAATSTLKAIAVKAGWIDSDIFTAVYTYTAPLAIRKSYFKDLNADGRIETVILEFEKDIPLSPDKLEFTLTDAAGKTETRAAAKTEIALASGSKANVVVTLAKPFEFGSTSVGNRATAGKIFKQDNIPTLEGAFPVDDSVPPVISAATVKEPDSTQLLKRIIITVSENVDLPLTSQTVLVFKKDGVEAAPGKVKIHHIEKTGDRSYTVFIDSTSDVYPVLGDSVALNTTGEVKDVALNTPAQKTFIKLLGDPVKPKPMNIYVTFPNSRTDAPSSALEPQGNAVFIPMDKNGTALGGSVSDGKCPGCYTGTAATFVGPVFHIVTPGPMTYDFKIFNTHGEFVARGKGVVTAADLEALEKKNDASGIKYIVRVVWTGRAEKGGKAGTGAYILQSTLTSEKDPRTGAPPGHDSRRITFGMLRSFRGS